MGTAGAADEITKLAVFDALTLPTIVTVYVPAAVGAAVKLPVAVPTESTRAQVAVVEVGVDCGWVNVTVSPTRQFG